MSAGKVYSGTAVVGDGGVLALSFKASHDSENIIHNIYHSEGAELSFTNETTDVPVSTHVGPGAWKKVVLHNTETHYYVLRNPNLTPGAEIQVAYDGVRTYEGPEFLEPNAWVYDGLDFQFTRPDSVDGTLPENRDTIFPDLIMARGNSAFFFNAATETSYGDVGYDGPDNTLWAFEGLHGNPSGADFNMDNLDKMLFVYWNWANSALSMGGQGMLGLRAIIRTVSSHRYFMFQLDSFQTGNPGGGFSYHRSTIGAGRNIVVKPRIIPDNWMLLTKGPDTLPGSFGDYICPAVNLTRGDNSGIYNVVTEPQFQNDSPGDTKWAFEGINGNPTDSTFNSDNWPNLTWDYWKNSLNDGPPDVLGLRGICHILSINKFVNFIFLSWGTNNVEQHPTMSYLRSGLIDPPVIWYDLDLWTNVNLIMGSNGELLNSTGVWDVRNTDNFRIASNTVAGEAFTQNADCNYKIYVTETNLDTKLLFVELHFDYDLTNSSGSMQAFQAAVGNNALTINPMPGTNNWELVINKADIERIMTVPFPNLQSIQIYNNTPGRTIITGIKVDQDPTIPPTYPTPVNLAIMGNGVTDPGQIRIDGVDYVSGGTIPVTVGFHTIEHIGPYPSDPLYDQSYISLSVGFTGSPIKSTQNIAKPGFASMTVEIRYYSVLRFGFGASTLD